MCGIVGYLGKKQAAGALLEGLYRLEYRGYDSAGVAVMDENVIRIVRRKGRVKELECARHLVGNIGIGHTRWATHGSPSEKNAHPHRFGRVVLVHNGIIENAHALKEECLTRGEEFSSETDSEVIAHLIERYLTGDPLLAIKKACERLQGSYALAVLIEGKHAIYLARKKSPLLVGKGEALLVASDLPALGNISHAYALEDGQFALLKGDEIAFYDGELRPVSPKEIAFDREEGEKETLCFEHFMQKEMAEIPAVLARSEVDFATDSRFSDFYRVLCQTEYIQIVACGTAFHAGLCAKEAIERLARISCEVTVASEYRYRDPIVKENTLCIAVSQSGETADTIAAALLSKEKGAHLAALTNVAYSSLTRAADSVLCTNAGREVAVAATKSFNAQLFVLYSVARALAFSRGREAPPMQCFSALAYRALEVAEEVRSWTPFFAAAKSAYFIGRGADYVVALEGSLKLKEISYLPSEGYAAGELKHGTLALLEEGTPVVAIATNEDLAEKTMNAVHEARSRGAQIFLVTTLPGLAAREEHSVLLPPIDEVYSPLISVIPLQKLAYYTALARGNDPDKPRNLAKSVTVE